MVYYICMSQDLDLDETCQTLFDDVMRMACQFLEELGSFFPVAEALTKEGEYAYFAIESETEKANEFNAEFFRLFKETIEEEKFQATAVAINVSVKSGVFKKEDAIHVNIQTRMGEFIDIITSYKLNKGKVELGASILSNPVTNQVGHLFPVLCEFSWDNSCLFLCVGLAQNLFSTRKVEHLKTQMKAIDLLLKKSSLPGFKEPINGDGPLALILQMPGYSGIHYLRHFAAYVWAGETNIPPYSKENKSEWSKLYTESMGKAKDGERFDHLMFHSDCQGFYAPIEFVEVIFGGEEGSATKIDGDMLGSSQRLLAECESLAKHLKIPSELKYDSDELVEILNAEESENDSETEWKRYATEIYVCLNLIEACKESIKRKSLLVFC